MTVPKFPTCRPDRLRPLCTALALALAAGVPAATAHNRLTDAGRFDAVAVAGAQARGPRAHAARAATLDTPRARPAGVVFVTNCDDSGPGSLRDAYFNASDDTTIDLSQLSCSRITLTTGALTDALSTHSVTLEGPGKYALTIDGSNNGRVLVHNGDGLLLIGGLTISNGSYNGAYGGGCIYSYGSVAMESTNVTDCSLASTGTDKAYGGAIYTQNYARLTGVRVTGASAFAPEADSAGGGVWAKGAVVVLSTFSNNTVSGDGSHYARGGGIFVVGDADISYSTFDNNQADSGGGIFLAGAASEVMVVANTTISGNRTTGAGAGLFAKYRPSAIYNSTITANDAGFDFGAGAYFDSPVEIESTIIAGNTSQDGLEPSDVAGATSATISGANNFIDASTLPLPPDTLSGDPMLGPLQDNGGPTFTHALLPGSPAIDHGNDVAGFDADQRAADSDTGTIFERIVGPSADIGAFEFGAPDKIFADGFDD